MDSNQTAEAFVAKWKAALAEQNVGAQHKALLEKSKHREKPIVHYIGYANFHNVSDVIVASVNALDHPKLGNEIVRTSIVVSIEDTGNFETLNTRYVKLSDKDVVAYLAGERESAGG